MQVRGLVKQHLDSFNFFVRTQIKQIIKANNLITNSRDPSIYLRWKILVIFSFYWHCVLWSYGYFYKCLLQIFLLVTVYFLTIFFHELCFRYKDVRIGEPSMIIDGIPEGLSPQRCRLYDTTWVSVVALLYLICIGTGARNHQSTNLLHVL